MAKKIRKVFKTKQHQEVPISAEEKDIARQRHMLDTLVDDLMGKDPAKRFAFITLNAKFVKKEDLDF